MAPIAEQRLRLQLQGLVQGVGFRPHVVRLAEELQLRGWVANDHRGVVLELQGQRGALERMVMQLLRQPPARARIDQHQRRWVAPEPNPAGGVRILAPSPEAAGASAVHALPGPDLAICSACLAELADPLNRRHRYPFISCTDCGPRYTIQRCLPFERHNTSLSAFPLCPSCQGEYGDPGNRRFHAQTISCSACGPQLLWNGGPVSVDAALASATASLRRGELVAIKGVGGFQLLARADHPQAVRRCRQRKGRPDKPLALLASEGWVQRHCRITPQELALWHAAAAPIVLVRRREQGGVAAGVAGCSPWLGVMRASSGLQQLLLEHCGGALVATSANRSGEPIAADAQADGEALDALADAVLTHTLPIVNPIDDSVMRWAAQGPLVLRLGRGLAPLALAAPCPGEPLLALGAHSKGSLALRLPGHRVLSPDQGDLGAERSLQRFHATTQQWIQRHRRHPVAIAADRHPGYGSTQLAQALAGQWQLPLVGIQHHHAHLLAVMAEHPCGGAALGVAWDGAGHGDDGTLWGGEGMVVSPTGARRVAHLRPFPLPGGARAMREPRRAALGLLMATWGRDWRQHGEALVSCPCWADWTPAAMEELERSVATGFQAPSCSSVGRLLDGLAALLDLASCSSYEAQAAQRLEGEAQRCWERQRQQQRQPHYRLPLVHASDAAAAQWDWRPLLLQLLADRAAGHRRDAIALAIHRALAQAIAHLAAAEGAQEVLLAGGCFQNALLLELSVAALAQQGCRAVWSQRLPSNDAAVAMGQLLALEARPKTGLAPAAPAHVSGGHR